MSSPSAAQQQQQRKNTSPLDWLIPASGPAEIGYAPDADLFESELDLSLAQLPVYDQAQLQLLSDFDFAAHDNNNFYGVRNDGGGPLSTITASSESAYDSESFYTFHTTTSSSGSSPTPAAGGEAFPSLDDFGIDFGGFTVDSASGSIREANASDDGMTLPGLLSISPQLPWAADKNVKQPLYASTLPAYMPEPKLTAARFPIPSSALGAVAGVSLDAINMAPQQPQHHLVMQAYPQQPMDPRKKYTCPNCPRSFARAFNLKTHMATHDPNRPKPHVCPHPLCNRSFSRKHDLGRHLISIHREDHNSSSGPRGVGVGNAAARSWCDGCGRGWIGKQKACICDERVGHDVDVK